MLRALLTWLVRYRWGVFSWFDVFCFPLMTAWGGWVISRGPGVVSLLLIVAVNAALGGVSVLLNRAVGHAYGENLTEQR